MSTVTTEIAHRAFFSEGPAAADAFRAFVEAALDRPSLHGVEVSLDADGDGRSAYRLRVRCRATDASVDYDLAPHTTPRLSRYALMRRGATVGYGPLNPVLFSWLFEDLHTLYRNADNAGYKTAAKWQILRGIAEGLSLEAQRAGHVAICEELRGLGLIARPLSPRHRHMYDPYLFDLPAPFTGWLEVRLDTMDATLLFNGEGSPYLKTSLKNLRADLLTARRVLVNVVR